MNNEATLKPPHPRASVAQGGAWHTVCPSPTDKGHPGIKARLPGEAMVLTSWWAISTSVSAFQCQSAQRTKDSYRVLPFVRLASASTSHRAMADTSKVITLCCISAYFKRNVSNPHSSQHWVRIQDTWVLDLASTSDLGEPHFSEWETG